MGTIFADIRAVQTDSQLAPLSTNVIQAIASGFYTLLITIHASNSPPETKPII